MHADFTPSCKYFPPQFRGNVLSSVIEIFSISVNTVPGYGKGGFMLAYKELQDILGATLKWEQNMLDLYEVAEIGIKDKDAKSALTFLKDNHVSHMDVLKNVDVKKFGPTEWVRYSLDYRTDDLIPKKAINRNSSAEEIWTLILDYEEKLKTFYRDVTDRLNTEKQKELFESLVLFKENQIQRILSSKNKHL